MHTASLTARLASVAALTALAAFSLPAQLPLSEPHASATVPAHAEAYRDLDLLRRDGFRSAQTATALLRITGKNNEPPSDLKPRDFIFLVNGTPRAGRLRAPGVSTAAVIPLVLLVFPPNQPLIHAIAVRECRKYFAGQPETLGWNVGIFDANGKLTPFTRRRAELLACLAAVDRTLEPFQFVPLLSDPWESPWSAKARDAIASMQRSTAPRIVLAMNPLAEGPYGENQRLLASNPPESFLPIAQDTGAHIYIADVGGPEVIVPGGPAAEATPSGSALANQSRIDPKFTAALAYYTAKNQANLQTAHDTFGGIANSIGELAGKINHDLASNYSIDFDLTPEDTDRGTPAVAIHLIRRDLRAAVLDVVPVSPPLEHALASKDLVGILHAASKHPVTSPNFHITQRVDYFPLREGLEPVLPMTGEIAWTGAGQAPPVLFVAESIDDTNLAMPVLEREVDVHWNGRKLSWERDSRLRPGNYVWRIAVHDGEGRVFASSEEKVGVGVPRSPQLALSSLIVGKTCLESDAPTSGLRRRAAALEKPHPLIDPMRARNCRVQPDATGSFHPQDTLHAFVRMYPSGKWKQRPESWTATFQLRSPSGEVEAQKQLPFTVDSGSGYLASIQLPLDTPGIHTGAHTLEMEIQGPGAHGNLGQSRAVFIEDDAPATP